MKKRKAIVAAVAVTLTGLIALSLTGCEWFSFKPRKNSQSVASSLGYKNGMGTWLAASVDSPRSSAWEAYQEAIANKAIDPDEVSFLDFLKAINDDSASLTNSLRSSVSVISVFAGNAASYGSGVIYSIEENAETDTATAYVLTNYHVVYNNNAGGIGKSFYTYLYGDAYDMSNLASDTAIKASYVGGSMKEDIALLSMTLTGERKDFALSISDDIGKRDSDDVNVGEKVYAIGNPLGSGISVVSGIVGVEAEYVPVARMDKEDELTQMLVMRIDAPANHGNSGGGLFDSDGKLLGIVNAGKETNVGSASVPVGGFGYAIPANRAVSVAQSILDNLQTNDTKAAYQGLLGQVKAVSSKGVFNPNTQSIDIVETVKIVSADSRSPFGQDVEGKILTKVEVTDEGGAVIVSQDILRAHQVDTILYNLRKGFTVTLYFEGEDTATAQYSEDAHFLQIG